MACEPKSNLDDGSSCEVGMAKLWPMSSVQAMYGNGGSSFHPLPLLRPYSGVGQGLGGHPRARSFTMGGSNYIGLV
jgi:hypothetical protein